MWAPVDSREGKGIIQKRSEESVQDTQRPRGFDICDLIPLLSIKVGY